MTQHKDTGCFTADAPAALITGGARRVGRAIAASLLDAGWNVVIHYNGSAGHAEVFQAAVNREGKIQLLACQADLRSPGAPAEIFSWLEAHRIKLKALINSAAIFEYDAPDAVEGALFDRHMAVNLKAPILLADHFARQKTGHDDRVIINLLDAKLNALNPDFFSYTLSKQALLAATKMAAMKFAPNIRVCGIAPGITLVSGDQTPEQFERARKINPLGHSSTPEDIAKAVHFILDCRSITGQVITLDGGVSLAGLPRDVAYL